MWILERQGTEYNDKRKFNSFEDARKMMIKEHTETVNDDYLMENEIGDNYATVGDEEYYQSWGIEEEKTFDNSIEQKFYEIKCELNRADTGVSQYAFELMDTNVIRNHLYEVERLIDELKEMII